MADWRNVVDQMTVNMLPDDALLEVLLFLVEPRHSRWWQNLVHVCQRWRNMVFGSPRFLNLELRCTARTPVRTMLDVWPVLPIVMLHGAPRRGHTDDIFAVLEHHDRVCGIYLFGLSSSFLEQVGQAMQKPFPALTDLCLTSDTEFYPPVTGPAVFPDSFLGGFSPCLRTLTLDRVSFSALPSLLLSATDLRSLELSDITLSGYIAPEVMVACLSAMFKLSQLELSFRSPESCPSQASITPPPPARATLPTLTSLRFRGMCGYLEDLVARIDAPLLVNLSISFFNEDTFHIQQLCNFIRCTNQLRSIRRADLVLYYRFAVVELYPQTDPRSDSTLNLDVLPRDLDWRLSSLAQLCRSFLSSPSTLDCLNIRQGQVISPLFHLEFVPWLELLRPFAAVKSLHVTQPFGLWVMSTLREHAAEVLPVLQNIFLEEPRPSGSLQEAIGQFVAVRELSGHAVTVHHGKGPESG
jgi:hypothetical protein